VTNAMKLPSIWENLSKDYLKNDHMRKAKTPVQEESRFVVYDMILGMAQQGPLTMLDAGCGPGAVDTIALNRIDGVTCHGLDRPKMIALAKKNAPHLSKSFVECDMVQGLPTEGEYDVINFRHVFEHMAGFELVLAQAFRLATKKVLVTFFLPLGEEDHYHVFFGSSSFRNKYSKARFEEFLRVCGVWFELRELTTNVIYEITV